MYLFHDFIALFFFLHFRLFCRMKRGLPDWADCVDQTCAVTSVAVGSRVHMDSSLNGLGLESKFGDVRRRRGLWSLFRARRWDMKAWGK